MYKRCYCKAYKKIVSGKFSFPSRYSRMNCEPVWLNSKIKFLFVMYVSNSSCIIHKIQHKVMVDIA